MRKKNGFTLLELLAVIVIIGILAALLMPGINKAMRQAKANRALSEMQQLATVITQVYNEVGYYVRLEDLAKDLAAIKGTTVPAEIGKVWAYPPATYLDGDNDNSTLINFPSALESLWAGPYTTYKNYVTTAGANHYRPTDPWGQQYRMFWSKTASITPAGASGTMVIISGGPNKAIDSAEFSNLTNMTGFTTSSIVDDVYYAFNVGVQ